MKDIPLTKMTKTWLYNINIIITNTYKLALFPLDNIDDNFKYKSYIKKIMQEEWNITKKSIASIKHLFTENNIHFYVTYISSKKGLINIPSSMNRDKDVKYCWKNYLIPIDISISRPDSRPYKIPFPPSMKNNHKLEYNYGNRVKYCDLEPIFNMISVME